MKIEDRIYGEHEIREEVLVNLINSAPLQRLKGISQQGLPPEYWHLPVYSRFEHSIGVLLLLRKLNASLEEQVAGLLHDISHTAFSHVIDWVIGDPTKEDCQDKFHLKTIKNSIIRPILGKYGIDYKKISILENFQLLEREIPELCADRLDYALRDSTNKEDIPEIVQNLLNQDNLMIFNSISSAEKFARGYASCQTNHWAADESRARYFLLAEALKKSLSKKYIKYDDFFKTDAEVIDLILRNYDEELSKIFTLLKNPIQLEEVSSEDTRGITLKKKLRYVDPGIYHKGVVSRLSELSADYNQILQSQKLNSFRRVRIKGLD